MTRQRERKLRFDFDDLFDDSARRRIWRRRLWRELRQKEHESSFESLSDRCKTDDEAADDN